MKLYFGRAGIDHDKFIFRQIGDALRKKTGRIILLVPEQFTLQAERNAFEHIEAEGFLDFEIMSPSSLARRITSKEGGSREIPINKMGRHMLLSKIIREEKDSFDVFGKAVSKSSFTEMMTDLITEMKQYSVTPDMLAKTVDDMRGNSILSSKLSDISKIYSRYEEDIKGRFADPEDIANIVAEKIAGSEEISRSIFWISGFDYLTPQNIRLIKAIEMNAADVNIVMTARSDDPAENDVIPDSAGLFGDMRSKLQTVCTENGHAFIITRIGDEYRAERPEEIHHLERQYFALRPQEFNGCRNIQVCRSSSFYSEAETIAAIIVGLVRNGDMRYRDLFVACNDTEMRASVIKRVFEDYGIPVFIDKKRDSSHNPCIEFILSLFEVIQNNMRYSDVFSMVKTGFMIADRSVIDLLENYCIRYKIKGGRWASDFVFGQNDYTTDELSAINDARREIYDLVKLAEKSIRGSKTVKEKTEALYKFLIDSVRLSEQIEERKLILEDVGLFEYAQESAQIWESIVALLDQVVLLAGDETVTDEEYTEFLKSGFQSIETGVIPPSNDLVTVGTVMRSRPGRIKALFVVGANEGVLPAGSTNDSLISEEEQKELSRRDLEICKSSDIKRREEEFALYKLLLKAEKMMWIGYEATDAEGRDIAPSIVVSKIREIFPDAEIQKDIISEDDPEMLSQTPYSASLHLSQAIRRAADGEPIASYWLPVYKSLYENDKLPAGISESSIYTKPPKKLDRERVISLFGRGSSKRLKMSPSAIEKYAGCPFSYFVDYGLSPQERRPFEVGYREIGDVYHDCLHRLSDELTDRDISLNDENSRWMTITKEECCNRVEELIDLISNSYREGLLRSGAPEQYRSHRLKTACSRAAWAMITQVRTGSIKSVHFEAEFGRGKVFPEVVFLADESGDGIEISGKIDRVDIIAPESRHDSEGEIFVKIIDYKSGNAKFDINEVRDGKRLQLMLYLKSVMTGLERQGNHRVMPAGVCYFPLKETVSDVSSLGNDDILADTEKKRQQKHMLDGIFLDDEIIIECITGEVSGKSEIIPVKKGNDGYSASGERLLTEEEFLSLIEQVDSKIEELASDLFEGRVPAASSGSSQVTACTYCGLKSICTRE